MARFFLFISWLFFSGSVMASDMALQRLINAIESLSSPFTQTLLDEDNNLVEESSGHFYLQRPGKFRWNYVEPLPQEIVSDGLYIWIYDQELQQVSVKKLEHALGDSPALLLSSREPLEKNFHVQLQEKTAGTSWYLVSPRATDGSFNAMRLALQDGVIRLMELKDNFGQTTRIEFTGMLQNPVLQSSLFKLDVPPSVDVIRDLED